MNIKCLTIADYLSLYRIAAIPLLLYFIVKKRPKILTVLFALSLSTDALDGFIARRLGQTSKRGARLDSAGDLITFLLMVVGLFRHKQDFVGKHRFAFFTLLTLYLLQVSLAYYRYGKFSSFHTYSSKLAFGSMGLFYLLLFTFREIKWLFQVSASLMSIALIEDIVLVLLLKKPLENVKGIYWMTKGNRRSYHY